MAETSDVGFVAGPGIFQRVIGVGYRVVEAQGVHVSAQLTGGGDKLFCLHDRSIPYICVSANHYRLEKCVRLR